MSIRDDVRAFHIVGVLPIADKPTIPPDDRMRLRARLIAEECFEFLDAIFESHQFGMLAESVLARIEDAHLEPSMVDVADALGDIDYVVEGTRIEFGIGGDGIAREIQRSNIAKYGVGAWKREDGKVMKPRDWKPPNIEGELRNQGWDGSNVRK